MEFEVRTAPGIVPRSGPTAMLSAIDRPAQLNTTAWTHGAHCLFSSKTIYTTNDTKTIDVHLVPCYHNK